MEGHPAEDRAQQTVFVKNFMRRGMTQDQAQERLAKGYWTTKEHRCHVTTEGAQEHTPTHNPDRARPERVVEKAQRRRRRSAGTINRMASYKLDVFDPKQLDLENYVYRWVNEEEGRIRQATRQDDYDFVQTKDLRDFDTDATDSESSERVRMYVGKDGQGNPIYSYLLQKPREFFDEDMDAAVAFREDMMEGVVYRGEGVDEDALMGDQDGRSVSDLAAEERGNFYVPRETKLGSAAERRRSGPVRTGKLKPPSPKR